MTLDEELLHDLIRLEESGRLRHTSPHAGPDRLHPRAPTGRSLLSFCSNDYLGLANHPAIAEAISRSAAQAGAGAGASRLVSGEAPEHLLLEQELAAFLNSPAALLFPTGYQTNMGVITALAGPEDLIVSDAANHASIIDGCRLSRAQVVVYAHRDATAADRALSTHHPYRRRLLVTESLFSMDGDRAPLGNLGEIATSHDAVLIVDEAHALGVVGPGGRGLVAEAGIKPQVIIGTLGKAFAASGGFAAGSTILRTSLINHARHFIYTTACPPPVAAAASAALRITNSDVGDLLRARSLDLSTRLRDGLKQLGIPTSGQDAIVSVDLGLERRALAASAALLDAGILIPAIRPPTVPAGTSRLRITISAGHTRADVDLLLGVLSTLSSTFGWVAA
jgi:8-amino-7-oxononanoate synthase